VKVGGHPMESIAMVCERKKWEECQTIKEHINAFYNILELLSLV
jgi:hypothetical protein